MTGSTLVISCPVQTHGLCSQFWRALGRMRGWQGWRSGGEGGEREEVQWGEGWGMKGGREAILNQRCVVLGSLCSLSHPSAGYYTHTHTHTHTHKQNTTEISMTIVFQPVGVTKQGDHSAFLTEEERFKVSLSVGPEESSAPPVRPQNQISRMVTLEASWCLGSTRVGACGELRNESRQVKKSQENQLL